MSQPIPDRQSQQQDNLVKDSSAGRDLIFAPVQIGTKIETKTIYVSGEKITQQLLIKASPYKGLKRFNFGDREYFFGRDKFISRLFDAVNGSSLSLILGASGSGKSSVVRAGLIPELKNALYLDSKTFYDFIFTPSRDPFESLYRCLLNEEKDYRFSESQAEIARKGEPETLNEVISTLKKKEERWLLFIDQFEELFTTCNDLDKNNFIECLVRVANSGDKLVRIVLAMRSEFLGHFSFYPALGKIANQNNIHLLTEMYPDELREAIEQPVAKHGVVFEEGLVGQIIKDVEGQSGYLPLLQYTLNLLWESECTTLDSNGHPNIERRTLYRSSYTALEGVRGALQKRVNEIYRNLNQDEQKVTKQIFVKLVNIVDTDAGSKAVSRRAYRNEFVGDSVEKTLDKFIDENLLVSGNEYSTQKELLVSDSEQLKQSAIVEIAHEILLSSWDKLKSWLEQEKEAIILKNWLASETKRWQKIYSKDESRAKDELLKGSRFEQIVEFRNKDAFKNLGDFSVEENQFIDASIEWHNRQMEIERQRKFKELEDEVALSTEKERNQILNQALTEAQVTIDNAQNKRKQIIHRGLITLAGITAVAIAAIIGTILASRKLIVAQKGTQLEQESITLLQQFPAGELTALISALQNGEELRKLVKGSRRLQDYPTVQPLFVLQKILDDIHQRHEFDSEQGEIRNVDFTFDGRQIISAGTDREGDSLIGTIKVWSTSGKQLAEWKAHEEGINYFSLSPNRGQIVTAGADGKIRLWNLSGKQLDEKVINDVVGGVNYISFSSDGKKIVTAGADGKLHLWNVSGQKLQKQSEWEAVEQEFAGLRSVAISPSSQQIVSGGDDGIVRIWDLSGKKIAQWDAPENQSIWSVSFSPDGQKIAVAGKSNTAKLLDLSGKIISELKGHKGVITNISFSPNGKHLVTSGGDDLTIRIWNLSGKEITQLRGHTQTIWSTNFSQDSQHLVSAGRQGKIFLWDLSPKPTVSFQANEEDINNLSFSPDSKQIVTVGDDGMVRLWNLAGKLLDKWSAIQHRGQVKNVSFNPDGKSFVVAYNNNRVRIWSVSGERMDALDKHQGSVNNVNYSPDGRYIATAGNDGTAKIWNVSQNKITELKGHKGSVWDAVFSPNGKQVATAGADSTVRVWDLAGQEQFKLSGHQGQVRSVSFSHDGQEIVSAGDDGKVRLWNVKGKLKARTFDTYQGIIDTVSFSPDGRQIATAGRDGTVRIWDKLGRQIFRFQGEGKPFWDLQFSPDGQLIAAAEDQGTVYIWSVNDLDRLLERGCSWLEDYLESQPQSSNDLDSCLD